MCPVLVIKLQDLHLRQFRHVLFHILHGPRSGHLFNIGKQTRKYRIEGVLPAAYLYPVRRAKQRSLPGFCDDLPPSVRPSLVTERGLDFREAPHLLAIYHSLAVPSCPHEGIPPAQHQLGRAVVVLTERLQVERHSAICGNLPHGFHVRNHPLGVVILDSCEPAPQFQFSKKRVRTFESLAQSAVFRPQEDRRVVERVEIYFHNCL